VTKPSKPPGLLPAQGQHSDLRLGVNRCPFCHDDVVVEDEDWVSCRSCLARHHAPCWEESQGCSSCGESRFLAQARESSSNSAGETEFSYQAVDSQGRSLQGTVYAGDRDQAMKRILDLGLFPTKISPNPAVRAPLSQAQLRIRLALVFGVTAFVSGVATAAAPEARDAVLGAAVAVPAAVAFVATLLRKHWSVVCGGFLELWGWGLLLSVSLVTHVSEHHPETGWMGVALAVLGLLVWHVGGRWKEPADEGSASSPLGESSEE
jgi:hypothetical protein